MPQDQVSVLSQITPKGLAQDCRHFFEKSLEGFAWPVEFQDWEGNRYSLGEPGAHWCRQSLLIKIHTPAAGRDLLAMNILKFLDRFLIGEVDFEGNLYLLSNLQIFLKMRIRFWQFLFRFFRHNSFQGIKRAKVSIKSHYDIPQEALNVYLDKVFMSYSCGMFANPERIELEDLLKVGKGKDDDFDSLEKAQWRKFKDAVDFIAPKAGESLLDVGCGYGGQLSVALESQPFGKAVGWTLSHNQVEFGKKLLEPFPKNLWELNEGDYREDERVFDHITSTGMISHVGPRGLVPYVRGIRRRIRTGGRYVHHAIMRTAERIPLNFLVGPAFNKKYVWPGFHWFPFGKHVRALEQNGFEVTRAVNLSPHYAKTTAAWYERMMAQKDIMIKNLGPQTFRAWQIYLAGASGALLNKRSHVYRIYCVAV